MTNVYKVLGQSNLAATTLTNVYTVPASTQAVISTIIIANRTVGEKSFRIAIRPSGAAVAEQHYIAYGVPIAGLDSTTLTLGITLNATDILSVWASAVDLSVNIFGTEIS